MSYVEAQAPAVLERFRAAPSTGQRTTPGLLSCLIVSRDSYQCERLEAAASEAGWDVAMFADPLQAEKALRRRRFRLAVIDVNPANFDDGRSAQRLCRALNRQQGSLLVVCGRENDFDGEIWPRSFSAWMYLPGLGSLSGLTTICEEAAQLVHDWVRPMGEPVVM